ncbi:MAG: FG-GAP repeat protein, partial [Deltaproteobacteria bacterium]|nr:FG-GAP repeat protein [Deltaproteobacteria bacterium]
FPRAGEDWFFLNAPSVVDLTGDGDAEIIIGSGGYMIHAWDRRGDEPPGWPKFTGGWNVASPSVGDVDGDGDLDVVVGTREGWLYAWGTPASAATPIESKGFHHDERNTGNYHTPIPTQDGLATTTTVTTTTTTTTTFPTDDDPPLDGGDTMDDDAADDDSEPTPGPTYMTDDEVFERTACCGG